ncbi:MAG: glycosyltransferase [Bacteroidetes bacterium]|nr:glycosyltransferase [Bacteroidota bacterium]MBS1650120.1 glycosyltransferase [Bacteroidota bacterium]
MPLISVITICFNNLADVQKTCASVDMQTTQPFEHWIINGSTTAAIANWLESTPQPHYRKWITERDKGISDAFNKGIANANGVIIHLLNSGDVYADATILSIVEKAFQHNNDVQWLSGKIRIKRSEQIIEVGKPFDKKQLYKGMRSVAHPTWFLRKEIYERVGVFNLNYTIAMDYDLMCRLISEPYQFINKTMIVFDNSGVSSNNYLQSLQQNIQVYESYFGYSLKCRLWQMRLKILFYLLQTNLGKFLFTIKKKAGLANV